YQKCYEVFFRGFRFKKRPHLSPVVIKNPVASDSLIPITNRLAGNSSRLIADFARPAERITSQDTLHRKALLATICYCDNVDSCSLCTNEVSFENKNRRRSLGH